MIKIPVLSRIRPVGIPSRAILTFPQIAFSLLLFPLLLFALLLDVATTNDAQATPKSPTNSKRNPFKPSATPTPTPQRQQVPPLEQYPLSALSLTAIVTDMTGHLFASVEIPSGVGFKVVPGTILGSGRARVVQVTHRGIMIEETFDNAPRRRELLLRAPHDELRYP